ncbi:unnamed protein product [Calypogeia fissa]
MKRKAILLLAFACTVGSLGLLVTMPGVSGRDSTPLSFAKKTIAVNSIVIFSKSYCPIRSCWSPVLRMAMNYIIVMITLRLGLQI